MPLNTSYQQKVKAQVRRRVLISAVKLLTLDRPRSVVINPRHVKETMRYTLRLLKCPRLTTEAKVEFSNWSLFNKRLLGVKHPTDLKVLILCGPEPLNDLQILLDEGINPYNVWAVESDPKEFRRAVDQLRDSGLPVKIYPGKLAEFLKINSDVFDIIYFDGCSPFGSGKPNSLYTLIELFKHQRLAPLGVLITTFAGLEGSLRSSYVDILAAYFRYRYSDVPEELFKSGLDPAECEHDDEALRSAIQSNPEPYYSDFITRFISDLARSVVPNCRAFAFAGIEQSHLAASTDRNAAIESATRVPKYKPGISTHDWVFEAGDFLLNPGGYPVLSFMRMLADRSPDSPIWKQLKTVKLGNRNLLEGANYAALLENCIEGHWDAMGKELLNAIQLGWFDKNLGISCDVPMPNLMVNSILGIYGAPAFPNPAASQRFSYVSKETTMYTDLLVLDRCRSYFDWFPTVDVVEARFQSKGFQLVARCLMDRIGWADWQARSHPFRGAAMAGMGATKHAQPVTFGARIIVN